MFFGPRKLEIIILILFYCGKSIASENNASPDVDFLNEFSVNLFKKVLHENNGNIAISPWEAFLVLNATKTREFYKLRYKLNNVGPVKFPLSNDVFSDDFSTLPSFQDPIFNDSHVRRLSKRDVETVYARIIIVDDKQHDKEYKISANTTIYLNDINSVITENYKHVSSSSQFSGIWAETFDLQECDMQFTLNYRQYNVAAISVKTYMNCGELPDLDAIFVQIPYEDENVKMIVISPKSGSEIGVAEKYFDYQTLNKAMNSNRRCLVNFQIPKFEMRGHVNIKKPLMEMGYVDQSENLPEDNDKTLLVDEFIQNINIKIHEQGIRRPEKHVNIVEKNTFPKDCVPVLDIDVNQPALFIIVKNNKVVIMGRLANPANPIDINEKTIV